MHRSEAEHPQRSKKSSKRAARRFFRAPQGGRGKCCRRLPLERICAQYGFGFFAPEKSKFVSSTASDRKGFVKGESVPLDRILVPFVRTKGTPRRRAVQIMPLQKAPRRRQARRNYVIVRTINPSVSRSADTSPYAGEPLGRCDADKRDETGIACIGNPSVTAAPCHLPLHKGGYGSRVAS